MIGVAVAIVLTTAVGGGAGTLYVLQLRRRLEAVARAEHELRGPVTVLLLACARMRREPTGRRHARALEVELERMAAGLAALTSARTGDAGVMSAGGSARRAGRPAPSSALTRWRPRTESGEPDLESFAGSALAGWAPALNAAGRGSRFRWDAGKVGLPSERGAIASALGNLVANAAEHGTGSVEVQGSRVPGAVRVEVRNGTGAERARRRRGRGLAIAAAAASEAGGSVRVTRGARDFRAALELPLDPAADDHPRRRLPLDPAVDDQPRRRRPAGRAPLGATGRRSALAEAPERG